MKRQIWLLPALLIAFLSYEPINRSIHGGASLSGGLDASLPLIPAFGVPYLLLLPVLAVVVANAYLKELDFTRLALVLITAFLVSDLLFLLFQTYVPRPETTNGLMRFIYAHDRPYCDFPSQHVISATVIILYAWRFAGWRWLAAGFGTLVIGSTLFVKQHSVIGAAGGLLLAVVTWWGLTKFLDRGKLDA